MAFSLPFDFGFRRFSSSSLSPLVLPDNKVASLLSDDRGINWRRFGIDSLPDSFRLLPFVVRRPFKKANLVHQSMFDWVLCLQAHNFSLLVLLLRAQLRLLSRAGYLPNILTFFFEGAEWPSADWWTF